MASYISVSLMEAVFDEACKEFICSIKRMDSDLALKRLSCLAKYSNEEPFLNVVQRFNVLVPHITSADE